MKSLRQLRNGTETIVEGPTFQDPPTVLVMRRKAIRLFPGGQRVATYVNDNLKLSVAIPYNPETLGDKHIDAATSRVESFGESVNDDDGDVTVIVQLDEEHNVGSTVKVSRLYGMKLKTPVTGKVMHKLGGGLYNVKTHGTAIALLHGTEMALAGITHNAHDNNMEVVAKERRSRLKEEREEGYLVPLLEATIHSIHTINKTKTPAIVRFRNGSKTMIHHTTAALIMKLHSMMKAPNKRKIENLINSSPDGLKKVHDFAIQHMK